MLSNVISATEISRSFSEVLNRVYYQGQVFDIKRGKDIIAKIVPIVKNFQPSLKAKDFKVFLDNLPKLDSDDASLFIEDIQKAKNSFPAEGNVWE